MNFLPQKKFYNVSEFKISDSKIYYQNHEPLRERKLFQEDLFLAGPGIANFYPVNYGIYFSDWNQKFFFANNDGIFEIEKLIVNSINKEFIVFETGNNKFILENLKLGQKYNHIGLENSKLIFVKNSQFIESNGIEIKCSTLNANQFWTLDISKIGYFEHPFEVLRDTVEVQQFVGVFEGVLWVFLKNQVFLGIDIHTGQLRHKFFNITDNCHQNNDYDPSFEAWYLALVPNCTWFLDESSGKIKGLAHQCFVEIDLKKPEPVPEKPKSLFSGLFASKKSDEPKIPVKVYHFYEHMRGLGLKNVAARHTIIDEDSKIIYFMDEDTGRWGLYNSCDHCFEYISEQIPVETSKDKLGFTRLKEIKQGGGKVYVLDMQSTLHIFEKE